MNISCVERILLSSGRMASQRGAMPQTCYNRGNKFLITRHESLVTIFGGVAERLNAPVLKTGRPKGLVSSNLTPSATRKNGANLPDEIANCGLHLPKIRTQ